MGFPAMRWPTGSTFLTCVLCCAAGFSLAAEPPSPEKIARWVNDLSADQYYVRDEATRNLIEAGATAVPAVAKSLSKNDLEVTTRGILILKELALSSDDETEEVARQALERVAAARVTAAARRASDALEKLDLLRQERALKELEQLGARIRTEYEEVGIPTIGGVFAIEIGKNWTGKADDLRRLSWLSDVEQVIFDGGQVNDEWVDHIRGMKSLSILKIRRAQISDESLAILKELPKLRFVKLLYVPIGDGALEHLKECRQLSKLFLYGTQMSRLTGQRLVAQGLEVDLRKGAFLGISVPQNNEGETWFIHTVTPNSSAQKAGIRPGDVIVEYDGKPVASFVELMGLIARNDAGDTVVVRIQRNGVVLDKQITFGEWE